MFSDQEKGSKATLPLSGFLLFFLSFFLLLLRVFLNSGSGCGTDGWNDMWVDCVRYSVSFRCQKQSREQKLLPEKSHKHININERSFKSEIKSDEMHHTATVSQCDCSPCISKNACHKFK